MKNRIELLRDFIDELANNKPRGEFWFIARHMHVMSHFALVLAKKRNLNPEIAVMIGFLHDIHTLLTDNPENHAELGSLKAKEILSELKIVSDDELEIICNAIKNHSSKGMIHDEYSELAKDADVLSHYLPTMPIIEHEKIRLGKLFDEFGLNKEGA